MNPFEAISRLTAKKAMRRDSEKTHAPWESILLQITLPILLVLAFVATTKLTNTIKQYERKKVTLDRIMAEYRGTSRDELIIGKAKTLIDLQKQRIIMALSRLRYEEKIASSLYDPSRTSSEKFSIPESYLYSISPDVANFDSWHLVDEKLKKAFNNIHAMLASGRRDETLFTWYNRLIFFTQDQQESSLQDPECYDTSLQKCLIFMKRPLDVIETQMAILDDPNIITSENRKFAWDELNRFALQLKNDAVNMQIGLVGRMAASLQQDDAALKDIPRLSFDGESSEDRERFVKPLEKLIRNDLGKNGYVFFNDIWLFTERSSLEK